MLNVIVGVSMTAVLGGLLVPFVKGRIDRRSERYDASVNLVETLAVALWAYWKLALRVAYYGSQGRDGARGYSEALLRWDSDAAWEIGHEIQVQVSRAKRLLPPESQTKLDDAQLSVVNELDAEVDKLRTAGGEDQWKRLYLSLMTSRRDRIDVILNDVTDDLNLGRSRTRRALSRFRRALRGAVSRPRL